MTEAEERAYILGSQRTWVQLLRDACRQLGVDNPTAQGARWLIERGELIAILREVCEKFGDNNWPDDLHLGDVVEKHLFRHLSEPGSGWES